MSDFVFISETVQKGNLYNRIKEILIENGWRNISSRPSSDGDVFFSEGEDGKRKMTFRMKDYLGSLTTGNAASGMSNSVNSNIDFYLVKSYTPGTPGNAGVFERAGVNVMDIRISNANLALNATMTIYYHCNKNRLVMVMEYPPRQKSTSGAFFFIGMSDRLIGRELADTAPILSANYIRGSSGVWATHQADSTRVAPYELTPYTSLVDSATFPGLSLNGEAFFSDIVYGSTVEGIRGVIDGIYVLPANIPAQNGDIITDEEGKEYRFIKLDTHGYAYFSPIPTHDNIMIRVK